LVAWFMTTTSKQIRQIRWRPPVSPRSRRGGVIRVGDIKL
jgi:hypothetical protein